MNSIVRSKSSHADKVCALLVSKMNCDIVNDMRKHGVKYVIAIPPHDNPRGDVDYYNIVMFANSKKYFDIYKTSEKYAVYDIDKKVIVNVNELNKNKAYEPTRLD